MGSLFILSSFIFLLVGYAIGNPNYSILISSIFFKKNIREYKSGNPGATNATRMLGKKIGFLILILDILKPVVAVAICLVISLYSPISWFNDGNIFVAGFGALLGHCFPIIHKLKGGKGVACFLGFALIINPALFGIFIIFFFIFVRTTKYVSVSSVISVFIVFIVSWIPGLRQVFYGLTLTERGEQEIFNPFWFTSLLLLFSFGIIALKHYPNFKKLWLKEENKVSFSGKHKKQ